MQDILDKMWEQRYLKVSPKSEEDIEAMMREYEMKHGATPEETRENHLALLRFLYHVTQIYDL